MSNKKESDLNHIEADFERFMSSLEDSPALYLKIVELNDTSTYAPPMKAAPHVDWAYALQHRCLLRDFSNIVSHHREYFKSRGTYMERGPACLDIGSQHSFIIPLSVLANFYVLDAQFPDDVFNGYPSTGIIMLPGEAQKIPLKDKSMSIVTSMHAIEHFGLGRYGDSLDPHGDVRGVREVYRILTEGGIFIGSVPVVSKKRERVDFNRTRLYYPETFRRILMDCGFQVKYEEILCAPHAKFSSPDERSLTGEIYHTEIKKEEDIEKIEAVCGEGNEPDMVYYFIACREKYEKET